MARRLLTATLVLLLSFGQAASAGLVYDPAGYPHLRRSLPSGLDWFESGLYWLQDWTGAENPRDPASIIKLMEDQAARYFDLGYIAYRVGGPRYAAMDILKRTHFQNRVQDRLFSAMARRMGMTGDRMPRFTPLVPRRNGLTGWVAGGVFHHYAGPTIWLKFHFAYSDRGWRIVDVTSNGRSLVEGLRQVYLTEGL